MLDTHYPQITDNKLNDVEISLQEPISKINLRGKSKEIFAKARKVLSLILQNEANYDRTRDTARGYGALAAVLEQTVKEFYQEHTGTPIY